MDRCNRVYFPKKKASGKNFLFTCLRVLPPYFFGNAYWNGIRISSPSRHKFVHELGHGLGLNHAASFSRDTLRGATPWTSWLDYKPYGNGLTAMGGKATMEFHNWPDNGAPVRGIYFSGASGYLPNEMSEIQWWPKDQYAFVKPSETIYTLRRIGTDPNAFPYPACLVWKDARTMGYHWFSYHLNAGIFQDDVSDDMTGFAHVMTYGIVRQKSYLKFKSSMLLKLFSGNHDSPIGLRFNILESNNDTVTVKVSFHEELLVPPTFNVYTKNGRIYVKPTEPTREHPYLPYHLKREDIEIKCPYKEKAFISATSASGVSFIGPRKLKNLANIKNWNWYSEKGFMCMSDRKGVPCELRMGNLKYENVILCPA